MKIIAFLLSFVVLVTLSTGLIEQRENNDIENTGKKSVSIVLPKKLPNKELLLEETWQKAKEKKEEPIQSSTADKAKDKKSLILGESHYQLMAVFNEQEQRFVLLKSDADELLRLKVNDTLPGEITLVEIKMNMVAFVVDDTRVEFKLFEPQSHDKN